MLFITNRAINESNKLEQGRNITFNLNNTDAGNEAFFCERQGEGNYIEIGQRSFFNMLKGDGDPKSIEQILIYIHGYSNLPEPDIFPRALQLQKMFDNEQEGLIKVVPLIWPCDNDFGMIKDYWDDQKAADASAYAFGRVFEMFMNWRDCNELMKKPCMKRINVLAHSMGNRVFRESIKVWAKYDRNYNLPIIFRNSFLVAADMVNETLEPDKDGRLIAQCSRNVIVYHASDDMALRASKISNLKNRIVSRRLGHTGPENPSKLPKNVFTVDCDDVNTKYDFPMGHSYFLDDENNLPGAVFNHIINAIQTGRPTEYSKGSKNMILYS